MPAPSPSDGSATQPLRIFLVEDDPGFAARLCGVVAAQPDMLLAAHVASVQEGRDLLPQIEADIMLVDLGLPDGSGAELIRAVCQARPEWEIMVVTVFGDEAHVTESIAAGAAGYLLKDCPDLEMAAQIRTLSNGGSPISPIIARRILDRMRRGDDGDRPPPLAAPVRSPPAVPEPPGERLSPRETSVLAYVTQGYTYEEIAAKMNVSRHTVLTYVRRIYAKFSVNSKIAAVEEGRRRGYRAG